MIKSIQSPAKKKFRPFDWILALGVTAAAILLHLFFLNNAHGLWRDEAGIVRLATLPAFSDTWTYLGHESCPLFFPAAIRGWSAIGLGGTDFDLRIYGLLAGLLLLGAVWFNGWALTRSVPLISLGLLATNLTILHWGDSLRAYGTGSVLMLLAVALIWRFVEFPGRGRWALALLAAVASVNCLFQNAFLLLAVCLAGGAVCWRRNDARNAAAVFAIGLLAALSLIPYFRIIHEAMGWSVLSQDGFVPATVWHKFSEALAPVTPWTKWLWLGLGLLAVIRWAEILGQKKDDADKPETPAVFYATTALIAGTIAYLIYLRLVGFPTEVWYYLPFITFMAVCLEAACAHGFPHSQIFRLVFLCLVVALPFAKTCQSIRCRQTNMDLIAAALRERAGPDDLIILHPWYYGISFERYYQGKTPWTTLPDLADHRFHRYDLFKAKMVAAHPVQPVLDRIAATLQSGRRVWIVGWLTYTKRPPPDLGLPPNPFSGWQDEPYSQAWGASAGYLIATHEEMAARIPITPPGPVNLLEDLPLTVVTGWREPAPAKAAP